MVGWQSVEGDVVVEEEAVGVWLDSTLRLEEAEGSGGSTLTESIREEELILGATEPPLLVSSGVGLPAPNFPPLILEVVAMSPRPPALQAEHY